jgi:citrate lyase subunit beta/citryl-CoA lyase
MSTSARPDEAGAVAGTWLFVPGDRPERFAKASTAGADVVVVDLEDAVGPPLKNAARINAVRWIDEEPTPVRAVRMNAIGTPWHERDLARLLDHDPPRPRLVMLPKAEDPGAIHDLVRLLPQHSAVIALVETAIGVARSTEIALVPGVVRLALGTYDLAAQLGVDPDHGPALNAARSALVLASAIAELEGPIDGVTGDIRDLAQVADDVATSAAVGFAGKLLIHPRQVAPAREALAPPPEQVTWAQQVVAAADASEGGVVVHDDRMVDAPVVLRARRILRRLGRVEGSGQAIEVPPNT